MLSPTKKQIISPPSKIELNTPSFIDKASTLMDLLRGKTSNELKELLSISDKIVEEVFLYNQVWRNNPKKNTGSTAVFTFVGEAFNYLNPKYLTDDELEYADKKLLIFSGLYGFLKPLDIIMPYRLDIADRLKIKEYNSLYDFWSKDLTSFLSKEVEKDNSGLLLDLSSKEYSKAIKFNNIPAKIITPEFKVEIDGKLKTVAIWAKRMRGLMSREVIINKVTTEGGLQNLKFENFILEDVTDNSYLYIKR
ncbi:YaaA family protein [Thiospirochaeta perfilievii]|uniref:YaaA family protein n=1 Tax=Thiospirochaeta perfilievii TaxID=252967 RepID=UPI0024822183|nr:YaaA family protein [Thiospirochaeta perfilievii]